MLALELDVNKASNSRIRRNEAILLVPVDQIVANQRERRQKGNGIAADGNPRPITFGSRQ
eukprot:757613-Hanusia_phi.AAC.5